METQNGDGSSRGVGGQTNLIEVRLAEFCQHCLSLDEKIVEQAVKVLKEKKHLLLTNLAVRGGGSSEEAERYWFACICLVVKRLEEKSKDDQGTDINEMGLILRQIVRLAKLKMEKFLKELTRFIVKAGPILSTLYGADWENFLESKELQANCHQVISLSRSYNRVFKDSLCAFKDSIHGSKSLSGVGVNTADTMMSGTFAMTTSKWLQTTISPHLSGPSARLELFLASCDEDVTNDVKRRAEIILKAIFPSRLLGEHRATGSSQSTNLMDNTWAEQRRKEALKLYYRVLEAMCVAESQILKTTNLTFLTSDRFHRCMLTCSAELVWVTHTTVSMLFPAVLERTGITAFDLVKGIGTFIGHEESLPRELRRHLNSVEERLLESTVWERGSAMYNSLIVARPSLSTEINQLALLAEPMPSLDSIAMNNYSLEYVDSAPGNFPVSPTRPNPVEVGKICAETAIGVFFEKINKLAAVRINGVIERLQPSQQHIRENTYRLFQQVLNHQTSLFFNRHVGQIILCCLYGIAKISKVNLTFNEIIDNYRKQTHCGPQELRRVFVDWSLANHSSRTGQGYLDIVGFYNEVFVPAAKPLLREVGPAGISTVPEVTNNKDGPCSASPVSLFPRVPDMSPRKVSADRNTYVSPLPTSTESTQPLQTPSKDLADISQRLNSLNLQNGSSGSSSGTPMTSEQPDS